VTILHRPGVIFFKSVGVHLLFSLSITVLVLVATIAAAYVIFRLVECENLDGFFVVLLGWI